MKKKSTMFRNGALTPGTACLWKSSLFKTVKRQRKVISKEK
jgi:hypothetical protein